MKQVEMRDTMDKLEEAHDAKVIARKKNSLFEAVDERRDQIEKLKKEMSELQAKIDRKLDPLRDPARDETCAPGFRIYFDGPGKAMVTLLFYFLGA